jgi:hypothetical protein
VRSVHPRSLAYRQVPLATLTAQPIKPNPFPANHPLIPSLPCRVTPLNTLDSPSSHLCIFILSASAASHLFTHSTPTMPDASKPIQKGAPSHLVALPSLSNSLSSLPQAKSLAHVAVYTSSMSGQHAAESEAKVHARLLPYRALEVNRPLSLKKHCRTMSGRRKHSRTQIP